MKDKMKIKGDKKEEKPKKEEPKKVDFDDKDRAAVKE